MNGATCVKDTPGYSCSCAAGYTGKNCQINVNECEQNPCQNEATCNDLVNTYNCTCSTGYTGN